MACKSFQAQLQARHIPVYTDNTSAKAYVNRQGATRSGRLNREARSFLLWAERNLDSIMAKRVPGLENVLADWLSRKDLDQSEWHLHPRVFQQLSNDFGPLSVDLFTSLENSHLPRYFSREQDPQAVGIDALHSSWPPGTLYTFPPIKLLPRLIAKIRREGAQILFIAPHWPRGPWFPELLELSVYPLFLCQSAQIFCRRDLSCTLNLCPFVYMPGG